jgi:hypothetical protein
MHNQQLMLLVKQAYMLFDNEEEHIPTPQQKPITDWLTNWTDNLSPLMSALSITHHGSDRPIQR